MTPHSPYLSVALEAVQKAATVIEQFSEDFSLEAQQSTRKSDNTPVTRADIEAEKIIKQTLSSAFPDHAFFGEEGEETDGTGFPPDAKYVWIIDPIDGTKNFIRNIPLFATELALMKNDEVILGVSFAPQMGELLYAEKGKGAFLNDKRITVSNISSLEKSYLSFGSLGGLKQHNALEQFLKLENETEGHRGLGDCWSYHLLASGRIDIVVEASTQLWDIAALSRIVEEAGGRVTDLQGLPISRETRSVVATNGLLHEQVLEYFRNEEN